MKLSDYVFSFLKSRNIDTVFTVSGGGCMHLIDSLGKSGIKYICNHHEQASAIAAESYFRTSGKPGCVLVTTGPGGTNALTGVLCAYQDSIPMIIISGQVPVSQLSEETKCRQIGQQEFNIVETVKHMTKYSKLVKKPKDIKFVLNKAYYIATTGRPGPVWIDIPLDVQASNIEEDKLKSFFPPKPKTKKNISKVLASIKLAKKPVIVIGNGIKSSGTQKELINFLNSTNIPVMSGPHSAVDIVNNDYSYYAGRFGILGQKTSNQIIQESDLIISLGSRLNPKMIGYNHNDFAPKAQKIIVDVDKHELNKLKFKRSIKVNIDLKNFFELVKDFKVEKKQEWLSYVLKKRSEEKLVLDKHRNIKNYVSTYVFSEQLQNWLLDDSIIVTSDGTAHVVPLKTIQLKKQQQLFSNEGTAPMGYGLPAAIGAHFGSKKEVICIEGDGSMMMNLQELETVKYHDLPIKIFIINNEGYLSIKLTQNSFFKGHLVGSEITSGVSIPSFQKISEAFDIPYTSIKDNTEIEPVLEKVFRNHSMCIIEIFSDPNELHEPKVSAKGIDSKGKIIPGKLEDIK
jgi:acetolactate synthase-1/2/3 large subunit